MPGKRAVNERFSWPAPAKLNLFLHVTGRRADGYHDIQTLFQLLDWGDRLSIELRRDGRIRRVTEHAGYAEHEDLAIRAAGLLKEHSGCGLGAAIGIEKNIPAGAGLGGGSSDAATVLLVLNRLWDCGLSIDELAQLGLTLGADVPVFVRGRSAWGEGVGQQLQPVELGTRHYVLVFPPLTISTREVFDDPGLVRDTVHLDPSLSDLSGCRNDCEPVVLRRYPEMAGIMSDLAKFGAPRLTGTGSCVFLTAADKNAADGITSRLNYRYNVRAVTGVDHSPLPDRLSRGN